MPLRLSKNRMLLDGIPLNEGKGADVASASTIDIWSTTGNLVPITGTATISAFSAAPQAGAKRTLLCISTPTFTHGANFLLPGSADYVASAGDRIEVLAITTTQFRLSVIKASVLPDVQFATDGSGNVTGLVDPTDPSGNGFAAIPLDENDNAIANIVPRHDTMANLLLVADAGEGEIASASDEDALVIYKGGVGESYWKSELVAESHVFGTMNVTTGALVHFDLTNKSTGGFFDAVGNVNLTDNTLDAVDSAQFTHLEISAAVAFPAGDGVKRRAEIQYDLTGVGLWMNILSLMSIAGAETVVANITSEVVTAQIQGFSAYVGAGGSLANKKFRLAVSHDATGTLNGVKAYIRQRAFKRT